ncbi:MAG: HAD family hydrolase [Candidatus Nanohalobium sp.]
MEQYDSVIFDFDGVLLASDRDGFEWANKVREEKARSLGYDNSLDELRLLFETGSYEEFQEGLEEYGIDPEDLREWEKAVADRKVEMVEDGEITLYPHSREVLRSDIPVALVSNAYGDALDEIASTLDLEKTVDFWYAPRLTDIESYVKQMKPSSYMVEKACEELDSKNPLMVGDSPSDIKAAEKAEIKSAYLDRNGGTHEKADHNIQDLRQLEKILNKN